MQSKRAGADKVLYQYLRLNYSPGDLQATLHQRGRGHSDVPGAEARVDPGRSCRGILGAGARIRPALPPPPPRMVARRARVPAARLPSLPCGTS